MPEAKISDKAQPNKEQQVGIPMDPLLHDSLSARDHLQPVQEIVLN